MDNCSHCSMGRRDFIRLSFGSAAGMALASRFGLPFMQDVAPAKAVILLWMQGAASQFETWDPKPGTDTGGPTKAIDTGAGFSIGGNLPRLARLAKKYS